MEYRGILAAFLLILSGSAQAALVAYGDFTTDSDTGLDWLDHSITVGLSFNQVTAELGAGGLFEGWQVATLDQVHTYLTNAGWIGAFSPANNLNIGFVAAFEAMTTDSFTDDPLDGLGADRLLNDFASGLGKLGLYDDPVGDFGDTSYSFTSPVDPSITDQNTSTFLVRTTVIPIPAAVWLFLSGIVGLAGIALKRQSA